MKLDGKKVRNCSFKDFVERKCKCVVGEMFVAVRAVRFEYTNRQITISELVSQHVCYNLLKRMRIKEFLSTRNKTGVVFIWCRVLV